MCFDNAFNYFGILRGSVMLRSVELREQETLEELTVDCSKCLELEEA